MLQGAAEGYFRNPGIDVWQFGYKQVTYKKGEPTTHECGEGAIIHLEVSLWSERNTELC